MITAVVHVPQPQSIDALADTLSALVAGVAAGVIGDAVIAAADPASADLALVADRTGAALVACGTGAWMAAAAVARRSWLFCLEAGDVPAEGWIRTLDRFTGTAPAGVLGRLRRPHAPLPHRLAARIEALTGTRTVRPGDVVRREALPLKGAVRVRRLNGTLTRE